MNKIDTKVYQTQVLINCLN